MYFIYYHNYNYPNYLIYQYTEDFKVHTELNTSPPSSKSMRAKNNLLEYI